MLGDVLGASELQWQLAAIREPHVVKFWLTAERIAAEDALGEISPPYPSSVGDGRVREPFGNGFGAADRLGIPSRRFTAVKQHDEFVVSCYELQICNHDLAVSFVAEEPYAIRVMDLVVRSQSG